MNNELRKIIQSTSDPLTDDVIRYLIKCHKSAPDGGKWAYEALTRYHSGKHWEGDAEVGENGEIPAAGVQRIKRYQEMLAAANENNHYCSEDIRFMSVKNGGAGENINDYLDGNNKHFAPQGCFEDDMTRQHMNAALKGKHCGFNYSMRGAYDLPQHKVYINANNKVGVQIAFALRKDGKSPAGVTCKYAPSPAKRDDNVVFYTETERLPKLVKALQTIIKENPEWKDQIHPPPIMSGAIGLIGIADEVENGKDSFNSMMAKIIEDTFAQAADITDIEQLRATIRRGLAAQGRCPQRPFFKQSTIKMAEPQQQDGTGRCQ